MSYNITIHEPAAVHHTACIGDGTVIWAFASIAEGVSIGKHCVIGATTFLGPHCQIGDYTRIHHGAAIPANCTVGQYCFVGANVVLMDVARPNVRHPEVEVHQPPVIEDDVMLGSGALVLPGITIHTGAIIGAGAVVTRDVKPGCVVKGNPARMALRPRRQQQGQSYG